MDKGIKVLMNRNHLITHCGSPSKVEDYQNLNSMYRE